MLIFSPNCNLVPMASHGYSTDTSIAIASDATTCNLVPIAHQYIIFQFPSMAKGLNFFFLWIINIPRAILCKSFIAGLQLGLDWVDPDMEWTGERERETEKRCCEGRIKKEDKGWVKKTIILRVKYNDLSWGLPLIHKVSLIFEKL